MSVLAFGHSTPHGGDDVTSMKQDKTASVYLRGVTEPGKRVTLGLTEIGKCIDLRKLTEAGHLPSFRNGSIARLLCVGPMPSLASASLVGIPASSSRPRRSDCGGMSASASATSSARMAGAGRPRGMHGPTRAAR